tara:strand:- start:26 stop:1036 length:1011 start_codon:yes stop_codon:yes gene_type:complete
MKFLVIGSNSFSGSHFVNELLSKNHNVLAVSRSKNVRSVFLPYHWGNREEYSSNFVRGVFRFEQINLNTDLKKLVQLIEEFKPEYIVNFASQGMVAESWLNPNHWFTTNLLSQVSFHDEIRKCKFLKKYVHISTPEVYGDTEEWIKESNDFNPTTPYSVSRAACEMHLQSFYKAYGFPVIFTRAANVYGPGQQLYRIIPKTILSIISQKKIDLHGGGFSRRSFIHISDVIKATYKLTIDAAPGTVWHISTNDAISIRDLVKKICKIKKVSFESLVNIVDDRLGKDKNYLLDSSNLRNSFNWNDEIKLEEGIEDTIKWVEDNFEELSLLPWTYQHKI